MNIKIKELHGVFGVCVILFSTIPGNANAYNLNYFSPLRSDGRIRIRDCFPGIIGNYGEFCSSNKYGHLQAGIDIKGDFCEPVYSIGEGEVTAVFREFPDKTVYIRHFDHGTTFTSVYIHLEDIKVQVGDFVSKSTVIGRVLTEMSFMIPISIHRHICI